jgi:hypothetical protein
MRHQKSAACWFCFVDMLKIINLANYHKLTRQWWVFSMVHIDGQYIGDRKEEVFDIIYRTLTEAQNDTDEQDVEIDLAVEQGYGEGWAFVARWIFEDEEDDTGVCITGFTERKYAQQCLDAFKAYASKQHGLELDDVDPPQLIPVTDFNDPRAKGQAVVYLTAEDHSGLLKLPCEISSPRWPKKRKRNLSSTVPLRMSIWPLMRMTI